MSQELANLPTVELFQNDGSPSARKLFILWNPTLRPKAVSWCSIILVKCWSSYISNWTYFNKLNDVATQLQMLKKARFATDNDELADGSANFVRSRWSNPHEYGLQQYIATINLIYACLFWLACFGQRKRSSSLMYYWKLFLKHKLILNVVVNIVA